MDFYTLLGVTRAASAGEIERAYRRLARRYHPGINPGDRVAEETYRQLLEAYDVLGDVDRRRDYDRGVHVTVTAVEPEVTVSFEGFDFSAPAEGAAAATFSEMFSGVFQHAARRATAPERGADLEAEVTLPFEDAMRGGAFPLSVTRQDRCTTCGGDGRQARVPAPCPDCRGQGMRRWARGHMVFTAPCETCGGDGQVSVQRCRACGGLGVQARGEVVTVASPPGIEDGATIVVPGRGHASTQGGAAGDLYIRVKVGAHRVFRRAGRNLHVTVPVAVHEAMLGATVDVPTLGDPVSIQVPAGASSGQTIRIVGRGVPPIVQTDPVGDLLVEIQIVLPPVRDERSRELIREFGRLNDVNVRRHLFEEQ